jgi:predicted permease
MRSVLRDFRQAARRLGRSPGFAALAIGTLALGIGGNAALFSIVDRIAVRKLPFPQPERLVRIRDTVQAPGGQTYKPLVIAWHWTAIDGRTHSFGGLLADLPERLTFIGGEPAFSFEGGRVSPGAFELLGVRPRLGRLFTKEEERQGARSTAALISSHFWKTALGERPDVLGSALRLADGTATIVGVLPEGFRFPYTSDVWRPLTIEAGDPQDLFVVGRLVPGVSITQATAELTAIASREQATGPVGLRGHGFDVTPLRDDLLQGEDRVPLILMGSVGFLLLLSCVNVAALLLSRSVARQREMGIRAALGASAARRLRASLAESLLLSAAGGALGLALSGAAGRSLEVLLPHTLAEDLPQPPGLAAGIALFALAVSLLTGALCGLLPAWRGARIDPASLLAGGRSATASRSTRRVLSSFVVAEVALATLLLSGGALMVSDSWTREHRPLGLDPDAVLSIEVPIENAAGDSPERRRAVVDRLLGNVSRIPGVSAVAASTANPFSDRRWGLPLAPDRSLDPTADLLTVNLRIATPGLFRVFGTRLIAGRDVSEADRPDGLPVAVVSRHLAQRLWGRASALGHRVVRRPPDGRLVRMTVVGVADDIRDSGDLRDTIYLPYSQLASHDAAQSVYVMVRGDAVARGWAREAVRAVGRTDPRIGAAEVIFLGDLYAASNAQSRVGTSLLAGFAAFGLLLAILGVFGAVSFVTGHRRNEIGVRIAVGASPSQIRGLVARQGLGLALLGCGIGFPLSVAVARILSAVIPEFEGRSFLCAVVTVGLLAAAAFSSDVPARRAARMDPVAALRPE